MTRPFTTRIAIITALERELQPLIRGWNTTELRFQGRTWRIYQRDDVIAAAGGIGAKAAEITARGIVNQYHPELLISAGFAGALIRSLKVASVITPNVIVDAATGNEYRCETGGGILVTAGEIASGDSRQELVEKFHGLAVDMEAAAVAEVAQTARIGFRCVKAISDEAHFSLPPMNRFVGTDGHFQTGKFMAFAAMRPWIWPKVVALARNGNRAARALCHWLSRYPANDFQAARVVKLDHWADGNPAQQVPRDVLHESLNHLR